MSVKVGDLLVGGFTGLLFLATLALYFATKNLADGEADSAERQLRAYVGVDSMRLMGFSPNSAPYCEGYLKNYGQTPASNLQARTAIAWNAIPETPAPGVLPDHEEASHSVLQKDGIIPAISPSYTRPVTREDAAAISAKKMAFYCLVEVSYKDVFGKARTTSYKSVFDIDGRGAITSDGNSVD